MFLSLVRPERISSPITRSAAVTSSCPEEFVPVMVVLMDGGRGKRSPTLPLGAMWLQVAGGRKGAGRQKIGTARAIRYAGLGVQALSFGSPCPADSTRRRSCVLPFAAPERRSEGPRWPRSRHLAFGR